MPPHFLSTASLPPPTPAAIITLDKKSNLLRNRVETAIHQASAELRKPVPRKYDDLRVRMEKLQSSLEEKESFKGYLKVLIMKRNEGRDMNVLKGNKDRVGDRKAMRDGAERELRERCRVRDERIQGAKERLAEEVRRRKEVVEGKIRRREEQRQREVERVELREREAGWLKAVALGKGMQVRKA